MAVLIPFPSRINTAHVDVVAWQLWRLRHDDDADIAAQVLADELDAMRFQLSRLGIADAEVERDLIEFEAAVRRELARQIIARRA